MLEELTGIYVTNKKNYTVIGFIGIGAYEYAKKLKDRTTLVDIIKLKKQVKAEEPEYDEDGIYTNVDRHTLKGLLTMPNCVGEVWEDKEHYYAMCRGV